MKILAIADDDFEVGKIEGIRPDVLLTLGDLHDVTLSRAIDHYCPDVTFGVRGNHDVERPFPPGVIDLHCRVEEYGGLQFTGFSGSWKYKDQGHHMFEQNEVATMLADHPPADIFIAHNSPSGMHERDTGIHQGFKAFNAYIERCQPDWFLHGHQHCEDVTVQGQTQVIGVYGERVLEVRTFKTPPTLLL
jgi:uncharacterized protein